MNQNSKDSANSVVGRQKLITPFFSPLVQPKLTINQPGEIYEQEADAMADKIMQMPAAENAFFKPVSSNISRKENSSQPTEANSEVSSYINSFSSKGSPLPDTAKSFFEPRLGYDFSDVKIHNDSDAAKSSQSVNALAYTVGNNIVFNQNQFSPETDSGKKLLAHELTHVVQQKSINPFTSYPVIQKQAAAPSEKACTQPTAVTIDLNGTQQMQYPGYGTGANLAGICALMKVYPETDKLCSNSIYEEVKPTKESTCPDSLINSPCSGGSIFSPGRKQKLCDNKTSANEFTDRHSIQVSDVSVMHDKTRNPKNLSSCKFVCHQDYFNVSSKNILGSFQIIYELTKAKQGKKDVTDVKVTKIKI